MKLANEKANAQKFQQKNGSLQGNITFSISKYGGLILNFLHSSAEVGNDVDKGARLRICFEPHLTMAYDVTGPTQLKW